MWEEYSGNYCLRRLHFCPKVVFQKGEICNISDIVNVLLYADDDGLIFEKLKQKLNFRGQVYLEAVSQEALQLALVCLKTKKPILSRHKNWHWQYFTWNTWFYWRDSVNQSALNQMKKAKILYIVIYWIQKKQFSHLRCQHQRKSGRSQAKKPREIFDATKEILGSIDFSTHSYKWPVWV